LGAICLNFAVLQVNAKVSSYEEDRRNARVQASYITRLVKCIRWEENSTESQKNFKIVVLGDETDGLVNSLSFLVEQSNLSSETHFIEVFHYPNSKSEEAIDFITTGTNFVYFTQDSILTVKDVTPYRNGALLLSQGRKFVELERGCIAFEKKKNRVKLIVNTRAFTRKISHVSPPFTSLKSVVEVVDPYL
jgi:hypothetical protein